MNEAIFILGLSPETTAQSALLYSLQLALILGIGLLLPGLLRLTSPRARLAYWQALLLLALLLPWLSVSSSRLADTGTSATAVVWVEQLVAPGAPAATGPAGTPASLLLWLWAIVAFARAAWLTLGALRLRSLRLRGKPLSSADARAALSPDALSHLGPVLDRTRCVLSPAISTPIIYGWRQPTVLLPKTFPSLTAASREAVLAHELVHIKRRDWLFFLIEEALRVLLWFHPALWLLTARIDLAREQVVDRHVITLTQRRREYLETLIEIARSCRPTPLTPATPLLRSNELKHRITALLEETPMSRNRAIAFLCAFSCASLLVLGAATALAARTFPLGLQEAAAAEEGRPEEGSSPIFVEGDVQKPVKVYAPAPAYPEEAKKEKLQGAVITQAIIDEHGDVVQVTVLEGEEPLANAAVAAIETWRFEPATLDGVPVSVYFNLTVSFRLE